MIYIVTEPSEQRACERSDPKGVPPKVLKKKRLSHFWNSLETTLFIRLVRFQDETS